MTDWPGPEPDPALRDGLRASQEARLVARCFEGCTSGLPDSAVRVGIDACDIPSLRRQLELPAGRRFLSNNFTDAELRYCRDRADRLGARWAAKEAVAKAIGTGFRGLRPNEIEICRDDNGQPRLRAATGRSWPHDAHTWAWSISLCHEADLAVAAAIAVIPSQGPVAEHAPERNPR
ncbi:holo-ACP synthase [Nocardia takedensis]